MLCLQACEVGRAPHLVNTLFLAAQSSAIAADVPELHAAAMLALCSTASTAVDAPAIRASMLGDDGASGPRLAYAGLQELQPCALVHAARVVSAGMTTGADSVVEAALEAKVGNPALRSEFYPALQSALEASVARRLSTPAAAAAAGASAVLSLLPSDELRFFARGPASCAVARILGSAGLLSEALDVLRDASSAGLTSFCAESVAEAYLHVMRAAVTTAGINGGAQVPPAAVTRAMEADACLLAALQRGSVGERRIDAASKEAAFELTLLAPLKAGALPKHSAAQPSGVVLAALLQCSALLLRHYAASGNIASAATTYAEALHLQRGLWPAAAAALAATAAATLSSTLTDGAELARLSQWRCAAVAQAADSLSGLQAAWLDVLADGRSGSSALDTCLAVIDDLAASGCPPTPVLLALCLRAAVATYRPDASESCVARVVAAAHAASAAPGSLLPPQSVAEYASVLCFSDEVVAARLRAAACVPAGAAVLAIWREYLTTKAAALAQLQEAVVAPDASAALRSLAPHVSRAQTEALVPRGTVSAFVAACAACTGSPSSAMPSLGPDALQPASGGAAAEEAGRYVAQALSLDAALAAGRAAIRASAAAGVPPDVSSLVSLAQLYVRVGLIADARVLLRQTVIPALLGAEYGSARLHEDLHADTAALLAALIVRDAQPASASSRVTFDDAALAKLGVSSAGLSFGAGHWSEDTTDATASARAAPALYVASVSGRADPALTPAGVLRAASGGSFWSRHSLCSLILALAGARCCEEIEVVVQGAWAQQQLAAEDFSAAQAAGSSDSASPPPLLLDRAALACTFAAYAACGEMGRAEASLTDLRFAADACSCAESDLPATTLTQLLAAAGAGGGLSPRQFGAVIATLRIVGCCASGRTHEALRQLEMLAAEHATNVARLRSAPRQARAGATSSMNALPFFREAVTAVLEAASALTRHQLLAVPTDDAPASASLMPYLRARALLGEQPEDAAAAAAQAAIASPLPALLAGGAVSAADPRGTPAQPALGSLVPSAASALERLEAIAGVLSAAAEPGSSAQQWVQGLTRAVDSAETLSPSAPLAAGEYLEGGCGAQGALSEELLVFHLVFLRS
jgi:hypothetical protein